MIKSQIRYDESVEVGSTDQVIRFFADLIAVTVAISWVVAGTTIGPVELLLWRPIMFGTALLAAAGWVIFRGLGNGFRISELLAKWGIWGLVLGGILSLTGLWHMNAAPLPFSATQAGQFLLTLGLFVPNAGPDALMRGFAWGIGIIAATWSYRRSHDVLRAVLDGIGAWLAIAFVFVFSSLFLLMAVWMSGNSPFIGIQDAVREFSRLGLNGYWGNMQMVRWFTGFGDQLSSMVMLFSASWVFVIAVFISAISFRSGICRTIKTMLWSDLAWYATAPIAGIVAGWSRAPWSSLDVVAWIVLFLVSVLLVGDAALGFSDLSNQKKLDKIVWVVILLGSGLLGWPVLVAVAVCASLGRIVIGMSGIQGRWSEVIRLGLVGLRWMALAAVGLFFMRRGNAVDLSILRVALGMLALAMPALAVVVSDGLSLKNRILSVGYWVMGGAVAAILLGSFAPLALVVLAAAVCFVVMRVKPVILAWLPSIMLIYAVLIYVLVIVLPRWSNPKLLPL